ncbi:hypothetical protein D3C87_1089340 [compost metagenome]
MKKILFFYFVFTSAYSQTPLHDILKSCKEVSEVNISKSNRVSFLLGSNDYNVFQSNKLIELYKYLDIEPEICMVPIHVSDNMNVYVKIPILLFQEEKNAIIFNVFNSYVIFDKKKNSFYQINSDFACGSIYKKSKKKLIINSSFAKLTSDVFKLDQNLNIISSNTSD